MALCQPELRQFAERIRVQCDLLEFHLFLNQYGDIRLNSIISRQHGQGQGTAAMLALIEFADHHRCRIILTTTTREETPDLGTTSRRRLLRFYGRFGFVPNRGRRKDIRVPDDMIRPCCHGRN